MTAPCFCSSQATFDSSAMSMDSGQANLCSFDTTLTTFDSTARTFDQTSCQSEGVVTQNEVPTSGADRRKLKRRRPIKVRYRSLEPEPQDIIAAVAAGQVAYPKTEAERVSELKKALRGHAIRLEAEHIVALDAERERLIALEVSRYMRVLQEREDEDLATILAVLH